MSTSGNVCGNCANFKPKQGEGFFNCTYAKQAGVKYAMQVRADTRSCAAFLALNQPPKPQATSQPKAPIPQRAKPRPGGLCPWGRLVLIAAIIILILLLAWGGYTCYSGRAKPAPTPTPAETPSPPGLTPTIIIRTPIPTPTPVPVYQYNLGEWVSMPPLAVLVSSATKVKSYDAAGTIYPPEGTSWLFVQLTVSNGSAGDVTVAGTSFKIVSQSGLLFQAIPQPLLFFNPFPYSPSNLAAGQTIGGRIVFDVPDGISQLRVQLTTGNGIVQWLLPW